MKLYHFAFGVFFLFFQIANSQNSVAPYYEFGAKGGLSKKNIYLVDNILSTPVDGALVGVRFLHMQQKNAGILVEANYNRIQDSYEGKNIACSYLHFPVMTHINFPINKVAISINLGTYGLIYLEKDDQVYMDKSFLYGLSGGLGLSYLLGNTILELETRYYFDLPSSYEEDEMLRSTWFEVSFVLSRRFFSKKEL